MKKILALAFAMATISLSVAAQDSSATKKDDRKALKAAYKGGKRDKKDKMKELNLSPEQKKEIKENRSEYKAKKDALDKDQSLTEVQRNEQKTSLKKEQKTATQALLTPEQKTKMVEAKKQNHQEAKEHAEKRMEDMKSNLSLSDEQASQLKALEMSNHVKMKAIRKDKSLDEAGRQKQINDLKTASEDRRKSILTREQLTKWQASKKSPGTPGQKKIKS